MPSKDEIKIVRNAGVKTKIWYENKIAELEEKVAELEANLIAALDSSPLH